MFGIPRKLFSNVYFPVQTLILFRYLIGRQLVNYTTSTPPPGPDSDEEGLEEQREEEVAMETPVQETGEQ